MSDNESNSSSSEEEDITTTGLIATRARRSNAGNRIASLLANLDDEELQKELLGDEEDDAEDYEGSKYGSDDDDAALESSSDEEGDQGSAAEGEAEAAEEKEVKRAERVEARRKRKARDARLKLPAAVKRKRVRVAEQEDGDKGQDVEMAEAAASTAPRPKKKSERVSWLPTAEDAPTRQSRRSAAVTNREATRANLEEQAKRSEKQKLFMRDAAVREKSTRRMVLSQEQRLEKMRRIEKETARELGRYEREEAERVRAREEALAAKRRRDVEGPFMRFWSGSAVWEGGEVSGNWKMKVKRVEGGSKRIEEIEEMVKPKKKEEGKGENGVVGENGCTDLTKMSDVVDVATKKHDKTNVPELDAAKPSTVQGAQTVSLPMRASTGSLTNPIQPATQILPSALSTAGPSTQPQSTNATPPKAPSDTVAPGQPTNEPSSESWLQGIQKYAAQPATQPPPDTHLQPSSQSQTKPPPQPQAPYTPSAPALNAAPTQLPLTPQAHPPYAPPTSALPLAQSQSKALQPTTSMYPTWPPGTGAFSIYQPTTNSNPTPVTPSAPPPPPEPLVREQALRTLLILDSFPSLSETVTPAPTSRRSSSKAATQTSTLEPTLLATTLLGTDVYPTFTPPQRTYLISKHRTLKKEPIMPPAPPHLMCAVQHTVKAKYRDAKTGLGYGDLHAYKGLQRVLAGGTMWSGLLGCWVGPSYGAMGRPARGVVEGFAGTVPERRRDGEKGGKGEEDVKMEGAAT